MGLSCDFGICDGEGQSTDSWSLRLLYGAMRFVAERRRARIPISVALCHPFWWVDLRSRSAPPQRVLLAQARLEGDPGRALINETLPSAQVSPVEFHRRGVAFGEGELRRAGRFAADRTSSDHQVILVGAARFDSPRASTGNFASQR